MGEKKDDFYTLLGPLVLMAVGGVSLYLGLPDDGPVMCGSSVMYPGDYCGPAAGRIITGTGRPPESNYDSYAADQHAAMPFAIILGAVLLALGVGTLLLLLRAMRPARRF
ncbi:hypothetical protein AB0O91_13045 [Kitasatospora sp. NPDC089797]|uniref:hypothetical protein n=1 Tax=Kitasatospora sp. NPDC089797 TaxID=3155298 RepID=UPI003440D26B